MDDVVLHAVEKGSKDSKGDLVLVLSSFLRSLLLLDVLVVGFFKENRIGNIKIGIHIGPYGISKATRHDAVFPAPFDSPILPFPSMHEDQLSVHAALETAQLSAPDSDWMT